MAATTAPRAPPKFRVGDLLRAHGAEFAATRPLTPRQTAVLQALSSCRTPERGGYVSACDVCDYRHVVYNPCRNRHCPSCEGQAAAEWLAELRRRLPPCRYFHVVFTLPEELRWLAFQNAKLVYSLLLTAAGETLAAVAATPKILGAQVGVTAVLHTWRRDLLLHPHVHCLVTAGGLSHDGDDWVPSLGDRYLAPIRLLAARFRRTVLRRLQAARDAGELRFGGGCAALAAPEAFDSLVQTLQAKTWLVYAKAVFNDLEHLLRYLGRYTHRVGISDRRIVEVREDFVTFATKNGEDTTIHALDFGAPDGFHQVLAVPDGGPPSTPLDDALGALAARLAAPPGGGQARGQPRR